VACRTRRHARKLARPQAGCARGDALAGVTYLACRRRCCYGVSLHSNRFAAARDATF
jgi:hypothetical protein